MTLFSETHTDSTLTTLASAYKYNERKSESEVECVEVKGAALARVLHTFIGDWLPDDAVTPGFFSVTNRGSKFVCLLALC